MTYLFKQIVTAVLIADQRKVEVTVNPGDMVADCSVRPLNRLKNPE
jgi:hypothetical protein